MQIVTVQFNYFGGPDYKKLLDVFKFSCKKYMPEAEFIEYIIDPPKKINKIPYNFVYNTDKLNIWADHMAKTEHNTIFADCDMMMRQSAKDAFNEDFDIAYTKRTTTTRIPMNGGIIMARPNENAVEFFRLWAETNQRMLDCDRNGNFKLHNTYRRKWAGMNQAAFGWMMEHPEKYKAKIHEYKTIDWNAVDCDWANMDHKSDTVFVHYKSRLRKVVLGTKPPTVSTYYCNDIWRGMYFEMTGEAPEQMPLLKHPPNRAEPFPNNRKKYKVRQIK
jgi:hypothetical protein